MEQQQRQWKLRVTKRTMRIPYIGTRTMLYVVLVADGENDRYVFYTDATSYLGRLVLALYPEVDTCPVMHKDETADQAKVIKFMYYRQTSWGTWRRLLNTYHRDGREQLLQQLIREAGTYQLTKALR